MVEDRSGPSVRGAFAIVVGLGAVGITGCGPTYPSCDQDEQCHEGEVCVNGRCQDCRDDSHCPAGQMCERGACSPIPGWCASDADCPADEECVRHFCRPRPVRSDADTTAPGPCQLQPAYFAFDEHALDDAARTALESDVQCMRDREITQIEVVGMCDPRGTEEYNMALGDRRARSAQQQLQRLGVDRRAIRVRSVGEEQATGQDEASWSRDRRADVRER